MSFGLPYSWRPQGVTYWYERRRQQLVIGTLIAWAHAVYELTEIRDIPVDQWTATEVEQYEARPSDKRTAPKYWTFTRYPAAVDPVQAAKSRAVDRLQFRGWLQDHIDKLPIYADEHFPICSRCKEPLPCREQALTHIQNMAAERLAKLMSRLPGSCWSCGDVITTRQKSVVYPGENLDLPGGPTVRFHTRRACAYDAVKYEERWLSASPDRERILTYPECPGALIVHADGTSECHGHEQSDGTWLPGVPDCKGHMTHNHGHQRRCLLFFWDTCAKGCDPEQHNGIRLNPRPNRKGIT